jgi:protein-tyrosine phosphatase
LDARVTLSVLRTCYGIQVRGFVDLHCHWIAGIDDGARTVEESLAMLRGLHQAGFDAVVATPHMRPGMFDNDRLSIERAFASMQTVLSEVGEMPSMPSVHLASEHFFDDVVYGRLVRGEALPYPRLPRLAAARSDVPRRTPGAPPERRPVLIEFGPMAFPARLQHRLFDLQRARLVPIIAHPERYEPVWRDDACLEPLLDAGAHLLLDVCSLVGKYGRAPQRAAEKLVEEDAYEAACSDAHKPRDIETVLAAIERLEELAGRPEAERLLSDGPRGIVGIRDDDG